MKRIIKCYSELFLLPTFEERFEYLKLDGIVGQDTFGFDRWLNQKFYNSSEYKRLRREIIIRDNGCDLGIEDHEIFGRIIIHHINPITVDDIVSRSEFAWNQEYLICVSMRTHNAIHYGDISQVSSTPIERKPFDTCPWRR